MSPSRSVAGGGAYLMAHKSSRRERGKRPVKYNLQVLANFQVLKVVEIKKKVGGGKEGRGCCCNTVWKPKLLPIIGSEFGF